MHKESETEKWYNHAAPRGLNFKEHRILGAFLLGLILFSTPLGKQYNNIYLVRDSSWNNATDVKVPFECPVVDRDALGDFGISSLVSYRMNEYVTDNPDQFVKLPCVSNVADDYVCSDSTFLVFNQSSRGWNWKLAGISYLSSIGMFMMIVLTTYLIIVRKNPIHWWSILSISLMICLSLSCLGLVMSTLANWVFISSSPRDACPNGEVDCFYPFVHSPEEPGTYNYCTYRVIMVVRELFASSIQLYAWLIALSFFRSFKRCNSSHESISRLSQMSGFAWSFAIFITELYESAYHSIEDSLDEFGLSATRQASLAAGLFFIALTVFSLSICFMLYVLHYRWIFVQNDDERTTSERTNGRGKRKVLRIAREILVAWVLCILLGAATYIFTMLIMSKMDLFVKALAGYDFGSMSGHHSWLYEVIVRAVYLGRGFGCLLAGALIDKIAYLSPKKLRVHVGLIHVVSYGIVVLFSLCSVIVVPSDSISLSPHVENYSLVQITVVFFGILMGFLCASLTILTYLMPGTTIQTIFDFKQYREAFLLMDCATIPFIAFCYRFMLPVRVSRVGETDVGNQFYNYLWDIAGDDPMTLALICILGVLVTIGVSSCILFAVGKDTKEQFHLVDLLGLELSTMKQLRRDFSDIYVIWLGPRCQRLCDLFEYAKKENKLNKTPPEKRTHKVRFVLSTVGGILLGLWMLSAPKYGAPVFVGGTFCSFVYLVACSNHLDIVDRAQFIEESEKREDQPFVSHNSPSLKESSDHWVLYYPERIIDTFSNHCDSSSKRSGKDCELGDCLLQAESDESDFQIQARDSRISVLQRSGVGVITQKVNRPMPVCSELIAAAYVEPTQGLLTGAFFGELIMVSLVISIDLDDSPLPGKSLLDLLFQYPPWTLSMLVFYVVGMYTCIEYFSSVSRVGRLLRVVNLYAKNLKLFIERFAEKSDYDIHLKDFRMTVAALGKILAPFFLIQNSILVLLTMVLGQSLFFEKTIGGWYFAVSWLYLCIVYALLGDVYLLLPRIHENYEKQARDIYKDAKSVAGIELGVEIPIIGGVKRFGTKSTIAFATATLSTIGIIFKYLFQLRLDGVGFPSLLLILTLIVVSILFVQLYNRSVRKECSGLRYETDEGKEEKQLTKERLFEMPQIKNRRLRKKEDRQALLLKLSVLYSLSVAFFFALGVLFGLSVFFVIGFIIVFSPFIVKAMQWGYILMRKVSFSNEVKESLQHLKIV